jgi:hypothetical protein
MSQKVTPRQMLALQALMEGKTVTEAAAAAGVSRKTVNRWRQQPAFSEAMRDLESEAMDSIMRGLLGMGEDARAALRMGLTTGSPAERVRAASVFYARLLPFREALELEERVAALEEALDRP